MKKLQCLVVTLMLFSVQLYAQLLDGTMTLVSFPLSAYSGSQVSEAGANLFNGLSAVTGTHEVSFVLDPLVLSSSLLCTNNIFGYRLYAHIEDANTQTQVDLRTSTNAGNRFPTSILYDFAPILGARNLSPANGGAFITLPHDGTQAILICDWIGCRTDIPLEIEIYDEVGGETPTIVYTVVGRIL